jgi:hypothetical protein
MLFIYASGVMELALFTLWPIVIVLTVMTFIRFLELPEIIGNSEIGQATTNDDKPDQVMPQDVEKVLYERVEVYGGQEKSLSTFALDIFSMTKR